jgi:uncharacterized protein YacL
MIFYILRGVFVLLVTAVAMLYILGTQQGLGIASLHNVVLLLLLALGLSGLVIVLDVYTPRKKLSAFSGVFLGLLGGLLAAYALSFVVDLVGVIITPELPGEVLKMTEEERKRLTETQQRAAAIRQLLEGLKVIIGLVTCYIGISLVLQTKDDFRFVIPYVEFARQVRGNRPTLLDTSIIIDGRILDIVATHILQGAVIVPRFVLNEMQTIADSADKLKRARGRRGLDILQKLRAAKQVDVTIDESEPEGANVDQKLVALAQEMKARLMTNDFNLKKVAELRGVEVINLNDLASAMRPVVLPGEHMVVRIQKAGDGPAQGVGYLDDGTMVVVENARHRVGEEVQFTVTSNYQTNAGRMVFGTAEPSSPARPQQEARPAIAPPAAPTDESGAAAAPAERTPDESHPRGPRPASIGRNPRRQN